MSSSNEISSVQLGTLDRLYWFVGWLTALTRVLSLGTLFFLLVYVWAFSLHRINGVSMAPTFSGGQIVFVDRLTYRFEMPRRGDAVIFRHPGLAEGLVVKRIIGLPNETVVIHDGAITINGLPLDGLLTGSTFGAAYPDVVATLAQNEYFVLGDNRPSSLDSRVFGGIDGDIFIGRVFDFKSLWDRTKIQTRLLSDAIYSKVRR